MWPREAYHPRRILSMACAVLEPDWVHPPPHRTWDRTLGRIRGTPPPKERTWEQRVRVPSPSLSQKGPETRGQGRDLGIKGYLPLWMDKQTENITFPRTRAVIICWTNELELFTHLVAVQDRKGEGQKCTKAPFVAKPKCRESYTHSPAFHEHINL